MDETTQRPTVMCGVPRDILEGIYLTLLESNVRINNKCGNYHLERYIKYLEETYDFQPPWTTKKE
jgi:hypothetical protein